MNVIGLIISLVCGAVGGNAAGAVMKNKSLGTLGNSLAGIFRRWHRRRHPSSTRLVVQGWRPRP
jgi:hypothetical protein